MWLCACEVNGSLRAKNYSLIGNMYIYIYIWFEVICANRFGSTKNIYKFTIKWDAYLLNVLTSARAWERGESIMLGAKPKLKIKEWKWWRNREWERHGGLLTIQFDLWYIYTICTIYIHGLVMPRARWPSSQTMWSIPWLYCVEAYIFPLLSFVLLCTSNWYRFANKPFMWSARIIIACSCMYPCTVCTYIYAIQITADSAEHTSINLLRKMSNY